MGHSSSAVPRRPPVASRRMPPVELGGTVQEATIHGDLHLDNILVGNDRSFVIDWPHRRRAPVAQDVAKLLTDSLRRELGSGISAPLLTGADWPWFEVVLKSFELQDDDLVLLRLFAFDYYLRMLSHKDVTVATKDTIRTYLTALVADTDWLKHGR